MKNDKVKGSKGGAMSTPSDAYQKSDHLPAGIITTPNQTKETGGRLQHISHTRASPRDDKVLPKPFDQGDESRRTH